MNSIYKMLLSLFLACKLLIALADEAPLAERNFNGFLSYYNSAESVLKVEAKEESLAQFKLGDYCVVTIVGGRTEAVGTISKVSKEKDRLIATIKTEGSYGNWIKNAKVNVRIPQQPSPPSEDNTALLKLVTDQGLVLKFSKVPNLPVGKQIKLSQAKRFVLAEVSEWDQANMMMALKYVNVKRAEKVVNGFILNRKIFMSQTGPLAEEETPRSKAKKGNVPAKGK